MFIPNIPTKIINAIVLFGKDIIIDAISSIHMDRLHEPISDIYINVAKPSGSYRIDLECRIWSSLESSDTDTYWTNNELCMDSDTTLEIITYIQSYPLVFSNHTQLLSRFSNLVVRNNVDTMIHMIKEEFNPMKTISPEDYTQIDVNTIHALPNTYPTEFIDFCKTNKLTFPKINTGTGKALSVMLKYRYMYWNRDSCNRFISKFNISTVDSIQLFNKHNQWGIETNSGQDRGKLYIVYTYKLSSKHIMRKNFKYDGTVQNKHLEINKIKSTIRSDYINVPNDLWQLGHKNPESQDNSTNNMVLQPPIQGKYRDNYIFIDTLTKFPTPSKLFSMIQKKEIQFTSEQINAYKTIFDKL